MKGGIIHFIVPSIAIILAVMLVPSVDAYQTVYINPIKASFHNATGTELPNGRIPGCEEPTIVNGTVIREAGCFSPNDINVKIGTLIIFVNDDVAAHSFTSDKFNSQLMINDGTEYSWVVEEGRVKYSCLLHPWAVGTITGVEAPGLDSIKNYPDWVITVFNWYDADIINYNTFINALVYLMSFGIVQDVNEEFVPTSEPDEIPEKCEGIFTKSLRLKLGCDTDPDETPRVDIPKDKCDGIYTTRLLKELGCPPYNIPPWVPAQPVEESNSNSTSTTTKTAKEIQCEGIYTTKIKKRLGCSPYDGPVDTWP